MYADITLKLKYRRYMAEILTIARKTLSNQSINQSKVNSNLQRTAWEGKDMTIYGSLEQRVWICLSYR